VSFVLSFGHELRALKSGDASFDKFLDLGLSAFDYVVEEVELAVMQDGKQCVCGCHSNPSLCDNC
jgi:hypothetical protein